MTKYYDSAEKLNNEYTISASVIYILGTSIILDVALYLMAGIISHTPTFSNPSEYSKKDLLLVHLRIKYC